ncbi:glycoside hydrolase family 97 protein [Paenibacillus puerhi]|uniref:glycoside hydrolase family 97 protein n=1 Tax=Paenibacillus puerhi TaxID=2692622 RepID=UPI00135A84F1|nr:glycoside hydrolase family 97 protein [Paenibacillus puerhi]
MKVSKAVSPNGSIELEFWLTADNRKPSYRASYKGKALLLPSSLGLELEGDEPLQEGFSLLDAESWSCDEAWTPVYGERDRIVDRFQALTLRLQEREGRERQLVVEFRVYDEGIAFRYGIPVQPHVRALVIAGERSQFHFPQGCEAYEEHGAEGEYHLVPIKDIRPNCERPLTVVYPAGIYAALTEAALHDYSRMLLSVNEDNPWIVESTLSGLLGGWVGYGLMADKTEGDEKVSGTVPFATPWRVLIVGDRPGDLLERNSIILNLNEPCRIEETSWIVPGKLIREVTLTPEGGRACVDFAAEHGLQYVMLDWGWYGDPFDSASVCTNPVNEVWFYNQQAGVRTHTLDIPELVRYGESKGIGIILYLDRRAVEEQIDSFLPVFKEWGIKGLKFGFVNTGPQAWTAWLHDCIRRCADYGLLVNVHDAYRTTGYSRTYPNLLTVEGIRGNEHFPTARHNATLPFTRFIAGCGDYTICYYDSRLKTTHAHQLAMSILVYSPLQSIMWYDKPSAYQGEPEIELFERLPTVWSETKVLDGEIGEFAVIARRRGDEWFVGAITNEERRELAIRLDFLDAGLDYEARIYSDDSPAAASRTGVAVSIQEVYADSELRVAMLPSGGQAMWIRPVR